MSLTELTKEFGTWADTAFEDPAIQAYGLKLAQEVMEVNDDLEHCNEDESIPSTIAGELADCLLVLCAIANRAGVDLESEARKKFEVNKARTWIKQPDGTHQHVK
jgi:NTP pyrophosphatase (non-canonical NTP hydrolase)